jgi:hypothetical protein
MTERNANAAAIDARIAQNAKSQAISDVELFSYKSSV